MGWELTPSNTGLASKGVTEAMLTNATYPVWGGQGGVQMVKNQTFTRRKFTINNGPLVVGDGAVFNECLITGAESLVKVGGNVEFNDCDFVVTAGSLMSNNIHIQPDFYYAGVAGKKLTMRNCRMTGGHIFLMSNGHAMDLENVYGYAQHPEVGGQQHRDGITVRGSNATTHKVTIRGCRMDCDQEMTTGAFFLQDTYGGGINGVEADDCMWEGAGWVMTISGSDNTVIRNNRIRPHGANIIGPVTTHDSTYAVWTDNHLYDPADPDGKGAAVGRPA